jgi:MarR family transcriptional regulator, organic hydroperoxide resistance regulator
MDQQLRRLDLTASQYALMTAINETPGSSGAELARLCFIKPQSVSGLVDGLLKQKLIDRTSSRTHGRIIEVRLTTLGRERLRKAEVRVRALEEIMLAGITPEQRNSLSGMLRLCVENLAKMDG